VAVAAIDFLFALVILESLPNDFVDFVLSNCNASNITHRSVVKSMNC